MYVLINGDERDFDCAHDRAHGHVDALDDGNAHDHGGGLVGDREGGRDHDHARDSVHDYVDDHARYHGCIHVHHVHFRAPFFIILNL